MDAENLPAFGLIVRSGPYQQRSARSQLDMALVAAALEIPVRLYFLGDAVLQLTGERTLNSARLPAGYRGWASLPEMTRVRSFAEPAWLERMQQFELNPVLELDPMSLQHMRTDWRVCDKMLIL